MTTPAGQLKQSANWHHKQQQRWAAMDRERPIAAVTVSDRAEAYMRFSANLLRLKGLDRKAWEGMNDRLCNKRNPESWEAVDVDVCIRLSDFDKE